MTFIEQVAASGAFIAGVIVGMAVTLVMIRVVARYGWRRNGRNGPNNVP